MAKALKGAKHVAVLDKNISLGAKGAVALGSKGRSVRFRYPGVRLYHWPRWKGCAEEGYPGSCRSSREGKRRPVYRAAQGGALIMVDKSCELFDSGHRACGGCGAALAAGSCSRRQDRIQSWSLQRGAWRSSPRRILKPHGKSRGSTRSFENASAVAFGIESSLKKQGRKEKVIVMTGDGATFDIGMLCISGAFERGHDITYICYDNEAYMNTGIQRSGATPMMPVHHKPSRSRGFGNKRPRRTCPRFSRLRRSLCCNCFHRVSQRPDPESGKGAHHRRSDLCPDPCALLHRLGI